MDGDGNILQQTTSGTAVTGSTTSYAYNPGNEICWSYSGTTSNGCDSPPSGASSYSYDSGGNQTSNGAGLTMAYNALDQMTSATSGGSTTDYSYLGEGQDLLYGIGSSQQLENSLLGVTSQGDGSSASTTYYTRAASGQLVDERTPTGTYNYLYDGNGNTTTNIGSVANPFGYQTGYTTSGLVHYGARYLNPAQGSWTQQDPLNQIQSLTQNDRYIYVGDDPINLADPSGLCFIVSCSTYHSVGHFVSQNGTAIGETALGGAAVVGGAVITGVCVAGSEGLEAAECIKGGGGPITAGGLLIANGLQKFK